MALLNSLLYSSNLEKSQIDLPQKTQKLAPAYIHADMFNALNYSVCWTIDFSSHISSLTLKWPLITANIIIMP